ncbi:CCR4-NOT transcription complex subunit 10-A-like [Xenopus laevis]|uniref:CCR4-NOT transcription complex subunit 10 n=1 Tax=Xenopus laevis TaxID=8355 RepID=A0A8J1KXD1_XENLA|nr:CCR4-NOT transcription complex subunit 10-A-like [Xenopus laevis]XP_041422019.1 CCR4-NOT transcription complex subunit 10-A-like [Xenopus laevis]
MEEATAEACSEEKFAHAVCFLPVDLYLLTFQTEKALHLLVVLEKIILQGHSNNKNGKNHETNSNANNKEPFAQRGDGGVHVEAAKSKIHRVEFSFKQLKLIIKPGIQT